MEVPQSWATQKSLDLKYHRTSTRPHWPWDIGGYRIKWGLHGPSLLGCGSSLASPSLMGPSESPVLPNECSRQTSLVKGPLCFGSCPWGDVLPTTRETHQSPTCSQPRVEDLSSPLSMLSKTLGLSLAFLGISHLIRAKPFTKIRESFCFWGERGLIPNFSQKILGRVEVIWKKKGKLKSQKIKPGPLSPTNKQAVSIALDCLACEPGRMECSWWRSDRSHS